MKIELSFRMKLKSQNNLSQILLYNYELNYFTLDFQSCDPTINKLKMHKQQLNLINIHNS